MIKTKKCKYNLCGIKFKTATNRDFCSHIHEIRQKRLEVFNMLYIQDKKNIKGNCRAGDIKKYGLIVSSAICGENPAAQVLKNSEDDKQW